VPITTLIDLEAGSQVAHYWAGAADQVLLLANTGGFGLLARAGDMHGRNRAGRAFLTLEPGEHLLPPVAQAAGHAQVACLALDGRLLVFPLDELKLQANGGRGLTLMDVDAKTPLVSVATCDQALKVVGSGRGGRPKEEVLKGDALPAHAGRRARKGRKVDGFVKVARVVAP
jgi:topoisomerase-4 subunit A